MNDLEITGCEAIARDGIELSEHEPCLDDFLLWRMGHCVLELALAHLPVLKDLPMTRRRFFVGDKVMTPDGIGYVTDVRTWRDRIEGLRDVEARQFTEQCEREAGPDYRETWAVVCIRVLGRPGERWYRHKDVEVLDGRDKK